MPKYSVKDALEQARKAGIESAIQARLDADEYELAALETMGARSAALFSNALEETFGEKHLAGKTLGGAVALLPRLVRGPVVTTNFDRVLEHAYAQADAPFDERV